MGKRWDEQHYDGPAILAGVERAVRNGHFDLKETDHDHPKYDPEVPSNKQIIGYGRQLAGGGFRPVKEAYAAFCDKLFGSSAQVVPVAPKPVRRRPPRPARRASPPVVPAPVPGVVTGRPVAYILRAEDTE